MELKEDSKWYHFLPGEKKLWNTKLIYSVLVLTSIQLVISLSNFENIVWLVNWESARLIAEGVPMYEQSGTYHAPTGEVHSLPPDHFPLYFYLMAGIIKIFGNYPVIGRIVSWIFVLGTYYYLIELVQPKTSRELIIVSVAYFIDPLLITINYYGKFDQIAIFFTIYGIYLVKEHRELYASIVFGIGVMTKFFTIFPAIAVGVYLLQKKDWRNLLNYSIVGTSTISSIYLYHFINWKEGFLSVILFQINRITPSLSIWFHILPKSLDGTTLIIYQLIFYFAMGILLMFTRIEKNYLYILAATSFLTAVYLVPNRQYYSTYAYFFTLPLIPVVVHLYRKGYKKLAIFPVFAYIGLFELGNVFCYNSCYPQKIPFGWYSWVGMILVFLGTLALVPYFFMVVKNNRLEITE